MARLAVVTAVGPDIFPVNVVVDHGSLVFRTAIGAKLVGALATDRVAVEADGLEVATELAWSVVVKGRAVEVRGLHELVGTFDLPLFPWHGSPKSRFIRVVPDEVTGRRFRRVDPEHWEHPLSGAPHTPAE